MTNSSTDYRNTLGIFPTGVTVITTLDQQGVAAGFTASSFNSVSLEPKLILWSLAKTSSLLTVFEQTDHYAVHFLSADQVDISNSFANSVTDRFAGVDWSLSDSQLPILSGCAAHLECEARYCYEGGDHLIFVGEVISHKNDQEKKALAYHCSQYSQCLPLEN